jgi:hypothetical protein
MATNFYVLPPLLKISYYMIPMRRCLSSGLSSCVVIRCMSRCRCPFPDTQMERTDVTLCLLHCVDSTLLLTLHADWYWELRHRD